MKRIAAFFMLLPAMAAQVSGQSRLHTGIQTGLSISTQTIDRLDGYKPVKIDPVVSFHARTIVDFSLTSFFSVQSGFGLENKGARAYQSTGSSGVSQVNLTYIEVPLNLKLAIPFRKWSLFAGGGPYLAKGISGSEQKFGNTYDHIFQAKMGANGYTANEYGLNMLAGSRIKNIQFSFQYGVGLTNSAPSVYTANPNVNPPTQNTIKNRVFSFGLGYVMDHHRKKTDRNNFITK